MMQFDEKEYQIDFFKEQGFVRKKCRICGSYFWTQRGDRDTCGDSPCEEYTFIGNPPTRRSYSVDETREQFLSFFEKNGHTRIKPYPVIARWREDLFLTIASIADFQPYVTEGIIPPPANPLVISQPCLRFSDVDNVGLTAGRHFVIFEMGGAHAFNYPDKNVYWKDETVRFHHRFITEALGIESEAATYKEGVWSGGGNAGPCLEGIVSGLEVCTLVFMQYRVVNDNYIDMPLKIVDTGYGIERYTWLSQGTPSGFHAVYGPILEKVFSLAGLTNIDERFLIESAKFSALMNIESTTDKMVLRRKVAQRLEIDPQELARVMSPIENAYAVTDHTKALAFMLAEGVVPSNVKAGYLTRLLVRRTHRLLRSLGLEDRLSDIVQWQIVRWSPSYPNLKEMEKEIHEALGAEERKYQATLRRGQELTRRIARELKSRGQKELSEETLVELYDSHGVPPEIVEEAAKAEEMTVIVPDNFYSRVAASHNSPVVVEEEDSLDLRAEVEDLSPTRMLYYDDSYIPVFKAKVLRVLDNNVILDETAFYPTGGGQDYDTGTLTFGGNESRVTEAQKIGNIILHTIEEPVPSVGQEVVGKIKWDRRISLMRHHTSTHIILGAVRRVLGQHSWQAGAEKEEEHSRLDVSHWDRITPEQIIEIERLANQRVMEDIPVDITWLQRDVAERMYGFRLYQGGVVPGRQIRVVRIGDWDVEACGGTHLRSTGEVGIIKILRTERIQDGVERIVFVSGHPALKYIQDIEKQAKECSESLNVQVENLTETVKALSDKARSLQKELERFKKDEIRLNLQEQLDKHATRTNSVRIATRDFREVQTESLIEAGSTLTRQNPDAVIIALSRSENNVSIVITAGETAVAEGVNSGAIAASAAQILGGSGGGRRNFGQGGGPKTDKIGDALKVAEETLVRQVKELKQK
ncbi:alanine--tRNA ligase [Candidatus Bathyarchaeota archaeon]|nr:alanine--tRNA ligase [Candidatus Bathyarchaeota archaeon]